MAVFEKRSCFQNLYTYAHNNPIKYYDPTGHVIDTVADIGFIAWDIYDIAKDPTSIKNWGALGLDVGGAFVPFVTGGGRALKAIDKGSDAYKAVDKGYDAYKTTDKIYDTTRILDKTYDTYRKSDRTYHTYKFTDKASDGTEITRKIGISKFDTSKIANRIESIQKAKTIPKTYKSVNTIDNTNGIINRTNKIVDNPTRITQSPYKLDLQLFGKSKKITGAIGKIDGFNGKISRVKTVEDLFTDAVPGRITKGRSDMWIKNGNYERAVKEFKSLNPQNVRDIPNGKVGILKDGRKVNVRSQSSFGSPTLEIQNGTTKIKLRYNR